MGIGTLRWMAPEMMSPKFGQATERVDVYSFAMVALELVTLKLPFHGLEDMQILFGIQSGERPNMPADCDVFLKDLIVECWQGDPTKRPQFFQILERLKSQKEESMWPVEFPNLLKLSTQFPNVGKIPKPASDIIIRRMNLSGHSNDWQAFVSLRWSTYTLADIEINFSNRMESVWHALVGEGETTTKIFDLLEKAKRKDVLANLEEYSQSIPEKPKDTNMVATPETPFTVFPSPLPRPTPPNILPSKIEQIPLSNMEELNLSHKNNDEPKQQVQKVSAITPTPNIEAKQLSVGKKWDFVAPMQSARSCHSAAVHGNFIYSIGGYDGEKELASVERYNVNSNSWESVASLGSSRKFHASVTCGDSIFCIGGLSDGSTTNTVEKYDVKSNRCSFVAPMINARQWLGAAAYREFIFATGGDNGSSLTSVEKYNTLTNQWSAVSSMTTKRCAHTSVTCGDSM